MENLLDNYVSGIEETPSQHPHNYPQSFVQVPNQNIKGPTNEGAKHLGHVERMKRK